MSATRGYIWHHSVPSLRPVPTEVFITLSKNFFAKVQTPWKCQGPKVPRGVGPQDGHLGEWSVTGLWWISGIAWNPVFMSGKMGNGLLWKWPPQKLCWNRCASNLCPLLCHSFSCVHEKRNNFPYLLPSTILLGNNIENDMPKSL